MPGVKEQETSLLQSVDMDVFHRVAHILGITILVFDFSPSAILSKNFFYPSI
jgi:hypothetical protein